MHKILVVDIETTGFDHRDDKIVEVGIVELNLENGDRKILFDKVTHEQGITREKVESSWIINNSDLTVEDVRLSKNFNTLLPEVQDVINKYNLGVTAFNSDFDFGFLENRGVKFDTKLACLMHSSTNICKIPGNYGEYKWPSVEEAYGFFFPNNSYIEKHRGADDAMHEAEIAYELFKRGFLIN